MTGQPKIFDATLSFIRGYYQKPTGSIYLHEPVFIGNERAYVLDAIDSTFVSSVGRYVDQFEATIRDYTGAKYAVATVNGTAALHMSLLLAGVERGDLVITQPLSFIATCNAISYIGADPLFIDIEADTLGLDPVKLSDFLKENTIVANNCCYHKPTGKKIAAVVPMHTFGLPGKIDLLADVCARYYIPLVEDAAESIGSKFQGHHTGTFGLLGAFSFNGNKTVTSGGGGVIITNDEKLGKLGKYLTTQAKIPHKWEFTHDMIGFNYRLPNINAALACAQLEMLDKYIAVKRDLANKYNAFFNDIDDIEFVTESKNSFSNYWLNSVLFKDEVHRDAFLNYSNALEIHTRPAWTLMNHLKMFANCISSDLSTAIDVQKRLVNLPSSVNLHN
jgi:perosamine synthetase